MEGNYSRHRGELVHFWTRFLFGAGLPVGVWFEGDGGVTAVTRSRWEREKESGGLEAEVLE